MAARLVAEEGLLKGLVLPLENGEEWVIGRDPDACQLLLEDPAASRKHLLCKSTPQGIVLENLSKTNPVQVNDEELTEPRLLKEGDTVRIGSGMYRFFTEGKTPEMNAAEVSLPGVGEREHEEKKEEEPAEEKEAPENVAEAPKEVEAPEEKPLVEAPPEEEKIEAPPEEAKIEAPKEAEEIAAPETHPEIAPAPAEEAAEAPTPPAEVAAEEAEPVEIPAAVAAAIEAAPEEKRESILEEGKEGAHKFPEINFDLIDTGRWLLKVIAGPNNGAEFSMQPGATYLIGTDPNSCDIVFHDTSVSRQHARLVITEDEKIFIEDLKSRNGTIVDGMSPLKEKVQLNPNIVVSLGTTSFVIYDREGNMQTIISPLLPSIVKVLQREEKTEEKPAEAPVEAKEAPTTAAVPIPRKEHSLGALILISIITGLFVIVAIGTTTLFKSEPVVAKETAQPDKVIPQILAPYPSLKYSFNKATGRLVLFGHLLTSQDKTQLIYQLEGLPFIKSVDDSGVIIDEYVWQEINQVLSKNKDWRTITVQSPGAGQFVLTGTLQTRKQADQLYEYISNNFPYLDRLEKKVYVEEEIVDQAKIALERGGIPNAQVSYHNGELLIKGGVAAAKQADYTKLLEDFKKIPGVTVVRSQVNPIAPEQAMINISDRYEVTGFSRLGKNLSVIVNGRIVTKGDVLDGMAIKEVVPGSIYLEKDGVNYRIDFSTK